MEYVNLGRTGLKVSRICLGCMTYGKPPAPGELKGGRHLWALNEEESQPFLRQALDLGINFFDTANVYSSGDSERVVGNFLKAKAARTEPGTTTTAPSPYCSGGRRLPVPTQPRRRSASLWSAGYAAHWRAPDPGDRSPGTGSAVGHGRAVGDDLGGLPSPYGVSPDGDTRADERARDHDRRG